MPHLPACYVLGTKYGTPVQDMLPAMLEHGALGIGFAHDMPLPQLVGLQYDDALSELHRILPNERPDARTQLARFFAIRPGDLIALKASGSPVGKQPRLVIARYAVATGNQHVSYRHSLPLGHTLAVDFLDEMDPIEFSLGYGRTLHHIIDVDRVAKIFGAYADATDARHSSPGSTTLKSTHATKVTSRGEYIMKRVHDHLQNCLYKLLREQYGDAVRLEADNIDITVQLPGRFLLVEVKSSLSPTYCIREALGQMLHYAWRGGHDFSRVCFLVVGPSTPAVPDADFLAHIRQTTRINLTYSTPETFDAINPCGEV